MPERITLSRAKGWRMPPNTVKVDRSTIWGNPFSVDAAREAGLFGPDLPAFLVECYANWLRGDRSHWMGDDSDADAALILSRLPELRGKNLACWCKPGQPCHADVLLELANAEAGE